MPFENVSFFKKASEEGKLLFFQHGKIKGTVGLYERWCLIGMVDAGMRINDNIDPNWANGACKWSVTITTCSFPYIGKSKEFDYVSKISTWGDKWFKSSAIKIETMAEFKSVVKDTKSNTKNITKSISIHSDYQSVHFWSVSLSRLFIITEDLDTRVVTNYKKPVGRY